MCTSTLILADSS